MRRAAALAVALALWGAAVPAGEGLRSAAYADPTTRYGHGVLGDAIEHGTLDMTTDSGRRLRIVLPQTRVFEDTAPRLADVDGDGTAEAVVVESDIARGARLAIYGPAGLIAATPFIGRANRWLAPVGVGDLDGDGRVELAYVDRPHLAMTLLVWRFVDGRLVRLAGLPGVTNHRIGERDIAGGIRTCAGAPEMILADAGWRNVIAVRFDGQRFSRRIIGPHRDRSDFAAAMACRP